jgi:hypothetical protein
MPKASRQRHGHQPASYGLGKVYCSPHRPRDKGKTRTVVDITGNAEQHRSLLRTLELLKQGNAVPAPLSDEITTANDEWVDEPMETDLGPLEDKNPDDAGPNEKTNGTTPQRILPDANAHHLYSTWRSLIPTLVDALLSYKNRTMGKAVTPLFGTLSECSSGCGDAKHSKVLCLFLDRKFSSPCNHIRLTVLQTSGKWK